MAPALAPDFFSKRLQIRLRLQGAKNTQLWHRLLSPDSKLCLFLSLMSILLKKKSDFLKKYDILIILAFMWDYHNCFWYPDPDPRFLKWIRIQPNNTVKNEIIIYKYYFYVYGSDFFCTFLPWMALPTPQRKILFLKKVCGFTKIFIHSFISLHIINVNISFNNHI